MYSLLYVSFRLLRRHVDILIPGVLLRSLSSAATNLIWVDNLVVCFGYVCLLSFSACSFSLTCSLVLHIFPQTGWYAYTASGIHLSILLCFWGDLEGTFSHHPGKKTLETLKTNQYNAVDQKQQVNLEVRTANTLRLAASCAHWPVSFRTSIDLQTTYTYICC